MMSYLNIAQSIQRPETDRLDQNVPSLYMDPEVFELDAIYMNDDDALIGWMKSEIVVIPWDNILLITKGKVILA